MPAHNEKFAPRKLPKHAIGQRDGRVQGGAGRSRRVDTQHYPKNGIMDQGKKQKGRKRQLIGRRVGCGAIQLQTYLMVLNNLGFETEVQGPVQLLQS